MPLLQPTEPTPLARRGLVFRATEIWQKTSEQDRALAEKLLVEEVVTATCIEDIAWEFVRESEDDAPLLGTPREASRARAFLILVYGPVAPN